MLAVALLITLIHAFNQIKFDYVSQRSTTDRLTSYPQTYPQDDKGDVGWGTDLIPKQNCALKRAFSNSNFDQGPAIFSLVGRERANIGMEKRNT
jgi:hypothetical protein